MIPDPVWNLPMALAMLAATSVFALIYLRSVSAIARWMALGPGRAATRAILGTFSLTLLYAVILAMDRWMGSDAPTIHTLAWLAFPIVFQSAGWIGVRALGERDLAGAQSSGRESVGLRDALLALALFGVAAAALRFATGAAVAWNVESDLREDLFWCGIYSAILLVVIWIDVAVRLSFAAERKTDRSRLESLSGFGVAGIGIAAIALDPTLAAFAVPVLGLLAVCYAGLAMAQEIWLRKLGVRATNVRRPVDDAAE